MKRLTFAIDFDGTFAEDPILFQQFIALVRGRGHDVVIVTGRGPDLGTTVREKVKGAAPIVFAGRRWKKQAARDAGYSVDIWIDDMPETIAPAPPILQTQDDLIPEMRDTGDITGEWETTDE